MAAFPIEVVGAVFQVFGSVFAKFALGGDSVPAAFAHKECDKILAAQQPSFQYADRACTVAEYAVRGIFFVLLLLANAFGMMLVLKGMARNGSLKATVLATATNTLVTAIVGIVLFGEILTLKWAAGAAMIVTGVIFLNDGSKVKEGESTPAGDAAAATASGVLSSSTTASSTKKRGKSTTTAATTAATERKGGASPSSNSPSSRSGRSPSPKSTGSRRGGAAAKSPARKQSPSPSAAKKKSNSSR